MKKISITILLILIVTSCNTNHKPKGFVVNGIAKNMPDSTKVVLYLNMETELDSTFIIDEKFQFIGKVERPRRVFIRMKSTRDGKLFWLENKSIAIVGEKRKIRYSAVSGSETQKEAEKLLDRKKAIYDEMNNLGNVLNEQNRDSLFAVNEQLEMKAAEINKDFIKEYPNSYESLVNLKDPTMKVIGADATRELFSLMSKELQTTDEGKAIAQFIRVNKNPKIGEKFVDFEQANSKGQELKFSELKGKVTLLEFWASWCGPCRKSNPELIEAYGLYKDKGFEIVGVSLDANKEKWMKAMEKDGLVWENLSDLKGFDNEAAMIYGVTAIPENFLIDENGIIIARYLRGDDLTNKLKELLEEDGEL